MKINSVSIQNFYSIQDVKLEFAGYQGLIVVEGKNLDTGGSNGAGKSALFEAMVWGLFGKTIRKSNEDALVNNKAKKNCQVTIEIDNKFVITRGRKPSKLEFFIDKKCYTQSTMAETQALIDETLDTNYKVFMASMVFGQHNKLDFLSATPEDKRTIIRNFLNLDEVFSKRDRVKRYKSQFNQEIKSKAAVIDEHIATAKDVRTSLDKINIDKEEYNHESFDAVSLRLVDLLSAEQRLRDIGSESLDLERRRRVARKEERDIRDLLKAGHKVCGACGGESEIDEVTLSKSQSAAQGQISGISKKLAKLEKEYQSIDIPFSSDEYSNYLEYKELMTKKDWYEELLGEVEEKIVQADLAKRENIKNYEIMKFWEKAFSEHGLIKYIIKNILDYLNDKSNTYLSFLTNGQVLINFNDELNEVLTINGKITHYISLSGGERRKVNLAVMLALQDLLALTNKNQSDILFFDEVAENLDEDGLKGLYILLHELKKEKNIFVITHNKFLGSLLDSSKRLTIIKKDGVSTLAF